MHPRRVTIDAVGTVELLPAAPYEACYAPDAPVVGFAFEAQSGIHAFGSDRRVPFQAKPNHLSFVPIGCDVYSRSRRGGEYLRIALDCRRGSLTKSELRFSNALDRRAISAAEQLRRHLMSGLLDNLTIERLVEALAARAIAILEGEFNEDQKSSWMTPRRLRLSLEQIEEQLATKLTVQLLADSLGLSAGFFSRAFRDAVGKAPHDYIIDRRLARARNLIDHGFGDLTDIALAVGFNSHAHMTAAFQRRLGTTPNHVRRGVQR